jgi:hypothetical protein
MSLRTEEFLSARLVVRTEDIPVPDLAAWFDGPPIWRVRALDANEMAKVDQADRRQEQTAALVAALDTGQAAEITDAVRGMLGKTADIESLYARQLEIVTLGSVDPPGEHALSARLGEKFPVIFKQLFLAIMRLTGKGAEPEKKPNGCGETAASVPPLQ